MIHASLSSFTQPRHACLRLQHPRVRQAKRRCCVARAEVKKLPIFPLGLVAFPAGTVPLQIFEARYRVLFSTLLAGGDKIDEGLVQDDSPFLGSKQFGITYVTGRGAVAEIGTLMEIVDFAPIGSEGRLFINNKGLRRYRILNVVQKQPVLVAEVELLEDPEDDSPEAKALAEEAAQLTRNILQLNVKMGPAQDKVEPEQLSTLPPRALSFWLGSLLGDAQVTQQSLLEEDSTIARLKREKEILDGTLSYLRAAVALQSLGSTDSSDADAVPPPGGPD